MRPRRRFPASVYREGAEPDPRFTLANERTFLAWIRTALANERTFLAWIRTALALLAGGVALEALGLGIRPDLRLAASLVLVGGGLLTPVQAWVGWMRAERAMRLGRSLPSAALALPLAVVVVAAGVLVGLGVLLA